MSVSHPDVLIVGGGVIGLSTALRLADEGVSVTLIDRQQIGREASWAGAGMLPPGRAPGDPTDESPRGREHFLRSLSNTIWADFSERLRDQTGIDNGYRRCGALELFSSDDALSSQQEEWQAEGIVVERLDDRSELERHVPGLAPDHTQAVWLPEFCQVRNPRHLKALEAACRLSGVEILEDVADVCLDAEGAVVRVSTSARSFQAERICITAGSWTALLLNRLAVELPVAPVRGQVAQLKLPQLPFRCVIEQGRRYLVPRPDGLILVGSTEEQVGFDRRTTSAGVGGLLKFASELVPELAGAELVRQWAGLRPGSPEGLPFLGRIEAFDNLYVGAGHFRSGLQMSPATAQLLADALMGADQLTVELR